MKHTFRIASPCSANWDRMSGNDDVRYCSECHRKVYNFSTLRDEEVQRILSADKQRICARLSPQPSFMKRRRRSSSKSFMIAIQRMSRVASIAFAAAIYVIPAAGKPLNTTPGNLFQIQPNPAGIILIVVDDDGAAISKARVALVNEKTKKKFKGETDTLGQFRITDIPDGTYEITIEAFAFEPLNQIHICLPPRVPLKLQLHHESAFVGEVSERRNPLQKFISKLRHLF
jgi:Carboxypeptidase regulatory-like domain